MPKYNGHRNFIVPVTVKKIRDYAFNFCEDLQSIKLPPGLTTLGESAFKGCKSLQSISIPDGIRTIPRSAFMDCSALKEVIWPKNLHKIQNWAFLCCDRIVSLTIPEGANIIEEYALPLSLREVHTRHKDPKKVARQLKLVRESEYCDDYRFTLYVPKGSIADYLKEDFFRNWLKIKEDIY
jgi:hypothetical protein